MARRSSAPDPRTAAIDVRDLRKSFGHTQVLQGLDLEVATGEVHAFLGPNGSGKTTTLRLLLGLLRADGGHLRVLGMDPWSEAATLHRRLAYVPGDVSLWPNLSGGEVIDLLGRLRGGVDTRRRDALVARFELDTTKKARAYSKGNRQKVALVAALASDVELYLLDEPTAGLDPLMEAAFKQCVGEIRDRGKTVLLSSHILSEAEALSDRVSIIRGGAVVETGTLVSLRHLTRTAITADVGRIPAGIGELPGVHDFKDSPGGYRETVAGGATTTHQISAQVDAAGLDAFLAALAGAGVTALDSHPPTLEEIFLRHYSDPEVPGVNDPGDASS